MNTAVPMSPMVAALRERGPVQALSWRRLYPPLLHRRELLQPRLAVAIRVERRLEAAQRERAVGEHRNAGEVLQHVERQLALVRQAPLARFRHLHVRRRDRDRVDPVDTPGPAVNGRRLVQPLAQVDQVSGVGTIIKPGDFVDVITGWLPEHHGAQRFRLRADETGELPQVVTSPEGDGAS